MDPDGRKTYTKIKPSGKVRNHNHRGIITVKNTEQNYENLEEINKAGYTVRDQSYDGDIIAISNDLLSKDK